MNRMIQRGMHFLQRIQRESKVYGKHRREFGAAIANEIFLDGLIPPGKSPRYLQKIEEYVDRTLADFLAGYRFEPAPAQHYPGSDKIPLWVCWWQGEESMPELVRMCYRRLWQVLPADTMELRLITQDNYREYVTLPAHIEDKFARKIITVTTLSDILRMSLMSRYGGVWVDATVFFTDAFPEEFLRKPFYSQKMAGTPAAQREACKSLWCGFCMAGYAGGPLFQFTRDAFFHWWQKHDDIVDYVLIDYLILEGYRHFPQIRELVDGVPNNNTGVFDMYGMLNQPYTPELYEELTKENRIHKLTYKMELRKQTADGQDTLYGFLLKDVDSHG